MELASLSSVLQVKPQRNECPQATVVSLQRQEVIGLRGNYCHQEDGPLLGQSRQEKEKQEGAISFLSVF